METVTVTVGSLEIEREMDALQIGNLMLFLAKMDDDSPKPGRAPFPSVRAEAGE